MRLKGSSGFTLIEIMVAVALVAILASIAIPSYSAYVVRGHRAAAKVALEQAAQFLERNYTVSGCYDYTDAPSCTARAPTGTGVAVVLPIKNAPSDGGTFTYAIAFAAPPAGAAAGQGFSVAATPCAGSCPGGSGFTDADCNVLTLDNTGLKAATGTIGTTNPDFCWGR
jgi:type IV pilus assembly protein PilE